MLMTEIERLIRRDPARRGLIATEASLGPLCTGHLAHAALDLAANGRRVLIVTGFFIPSAAPPAAETDGPPGAALLAAALTHAGMSVQIVTDKPCLNAVKVAAAGMDLPATIVASVDHDPDQIGEWFHQQTHSTNPPLTHMISIERVGPSHTNTSIRAQYSESDSESTTATEEFNRLVPTIEQGHCYNMRGDSLDHVTAPLHILFELAKKSTTIKTIGIGDGGNEIGMGTIPWHELRRRLNSPHSAKIPCCISTDWTIVAGVSNWGGMALAAAVLWHQNQTQAMASWTSDHQLQLLRRIVNEGPAVDGITRLREATVDGLPFLTYIQPWEGMRRLTEVNATPRPPQDQHSGD